MLHLASFYLSIILPKEKNTCLKQQKSRNLNDKTCLFFFVVLYKNCKIYNIKKKKQFQYTPGSLYF